MMKVVKRIENCLLITIMSVMMVFTCSIIVLADDAEVTVDPAAGNFSDELRAALETEHDGGTLTVNIPEGTYTIDKNIYIYSDTVLNAEGCTFYFTGAGSMLKGAHKHNGQRCRADEGSGSCSEGGYNQLRNVTVNGGTWDAKVNSVTSTQCVMFRHAQNITLKNMTLKGSTNHMMNISGVNTANITNCTFTAPTKYTGTDKDFWGDIPTGNDERYNSMEAIHLDFICKSGEPKAQPLDNTPCKNITVGGCTFSGVFSGVGTHHANGDSNKRADNIKVLRCTFNNIASNTANAKCYGRALTFYTAQNVTFENNTINGVYNAVLLEDVKGVVATNNKTVKNVKGNAFYVRKGCTGKITNNVVTAPLQTGAYVDSSAVTVFNNTITNAKTHGIIIQDANGAKANKNIVNGSATNGIMVLVTNASKTATVQLRENTVKNSAQLGILLQDGTNCVIYKNTVTGSSKNGIQVQGSKKKCTGTTVAYNTATGNKGKKDILINTKCNNTKVQFNTIPKAGRLYCYGDGNVLNKGNHYTNAVSIKSAKISGITNKKYNGKAQGQAKLKVVMNGKTLKKGTHYKLTFENNVKKGTARVHIIGQGAYKDYVTKTFKIN